MQRVNHFPRSGELTRKIFGQFELSTLQKIMVTVPGNHDYWILSEPGVSTPLSCVC